jgi:23S rRNA (pseudouridine1915-N3)-methyltransferase
VKITLLCIGRPARVYDAAITEYETRVRRYWAYDAIELKAVRAGGNTDEAAVRELEADRIVRRLPAGARLTALTRTGTALDSVELARDLERAAHEGTDVAYVIGGAFGLSPGMLRGAQRLLRLSALTLPHDLARLVLTEQLYRAGTILRGEPYHKGADVS